MKETVTAMVAAGAGFVSEDQIISIISMIIAIMSLILEMLRRNKKEPSKEKKSVTESK